MKKIFFFIILATTAQTQAKTDLNNLMLKNSRELGKSLERMEYTFKKKESPEAKIEDHCEFRKATRQHIKVLNQAYEITNQMQKKDSTTELKKELKETIELFETQIDREDQALRKEMNVSPKMKIITLDYICGATQ
ncbi:hypothetical protein [Acinetobacter towneri]|uniref:hypothetical protein n=1 Tax=Acinetobacter towneri TaxID=202956 RepID=UPI001CE0C4CB|nr:hypothetical protein [Acinetobacter towneri]MCA4791184.1 hypothetical protein [Acinetobacter towneri]